jgi:hypothetical protein
VAANVLITESGSARDAFLWRTCVSDIEEKLKKQIISSGKAQCWLKKHLTLKNGSPDYVVLESDRIGPVLIETGRMDVKLRWRRILTDKSDFLFEVEDGT